MEEKEKSAVDRAREYGIDISLLEANLQRTMSERLDGLTAMAALFEEAGNFRRKHYGNLIVSDQISRYSPNARGK